MPQLAFSLELKSLSDKGEFSGLASTYGNTDSGGDVVEAGAFTKTLSASKERPLLWQHRDPIGTVSLSDSDKGLCANGKLSLGVQQAREAYELLKDGAVKGMSIGFETVRSDYIGEVRHLRELKLWEISLTPMPMNESAIVTNVKSAHAILIKSALSELRREVLAALEV
jgi:uncharacterized protein